MRLTILIFLSTALGCTATRLATPQVIGRYSWWVGYSADSLTLDEDGRFEWRYGERLLFPVSGRWSRADGTVHLTASDPDQTFRIESELRVVCRDGEVFLVPPENLDEFAEQGPSQSLCLSPDYLELPW